MDVSEAVLGVKLLKYLFGKEFYPVPLSAPQHGLGHVLCTAPSHPPCFPTIQQLKGKDPNTTGAPAAAALCHCLGLVGFQAILVAKYFQVSLNAGVE